MAILPGGQSFAGAKPMQALGLAGRILLCGSALLAAALLAGCPPYAQDKPAAGSLARLESAADGLRSGTLAEAGLDPHLIGAGVRAIDAGDYGNIHSLLVFRHGSLVLEHYRSGEDATRDGPIGIVAHSRDTLHDIRSISKSVVALAVLLAQEKGQIPDLDQPVLAWLPEYAALAGDEKADITVRHLLTMTAGLDWQESLPYSDPRNTIAQMNLAPDTVAFVLGRPLVATPGTRFNYNGGLTQLLAAVVERATGSRIDHYTQAELLRPLGITHHEWAKMETGQPDADSGLRLRSRDLAKIGLLLMNSGEWNGVRLISAERIADAVAEHIRIPPAPDAYPGDTEGYGYQIWRFGYDTDAGQRTELIELSGNGGQKVQIDQRTGIMVVVTAANYGREGKSSFDLYPDFILPAVLRE
jgi:CubicO group peptidase (beta-lactamase class C family)